MSAENLIASYLRIAKEDLSGALLLGQQNNRNAIYLCEQAAEKIIRAILTSENVRAGVSHNLVDMISSVPDINPIKPSLREVEKLTNYATAYRYPNQSEQVTKPPEPSKFADFAQKVEVVLAKAATHFGVDLSHKSSPATNKTPIR